MKRYVLKWREGRAAIWYTLEAKLVSLLSVLVRRSKGKDLGTCFSTVISHQSSLVTFLARLLGCPCGKSYFLRPLVLAVYLIPRSPLIIIPTSLSLSSKLLLTSNSCFSAPRFTILESFLERYLDRSMYKYTIAYNNRVVFFQSVYKIKL